MSNPDMMEALQALAADKGISVDTLLRRARRRARVGLQAPARTRTSTPGSPSTPTRGEIRVIAQELDEEGEPTGAELDVTPAPEFGPHRRPDRAKQVMNQRIREAEREMKYEEYAGREGDIVTGIIQQSDSPLHAARPRPGRGAAAPGRAGPLRAARARRAGQGLHRRGPQDGQGPADRGQPHPSGPHQAALRARGPRDRRRRGRDQGLRPRARATAPRSRSGPTTPTSIPVGACVGARGARVRMVVNELRGEKIDIVPFSRRPAGLRHEGPLAGQGQGGPHPRGHRHRRGDRARLPALAGHRQGGPERPPGRPSHRTGGSTSRARPSSPRRRPTSDQDWAEGEWVVDPETRRAGVAPADGELMSVEQWNEAATNALEEAAGEVAEAVVAEAVRRGGGRGDRGGAGRGGRGRGRGRGDRAEELAERAEVVAEERRMRRGGGRGRGGRGAGRGDRGRGAWPRS